MVDYHKYYLNNKRNHPKYCVDCTTQISPNPKNLRCKKCANKLFPHRFKKGESANPETQFKFGEKHPNWQGGTKTLSQAIRTLTIYQEWRRQILIKDNYICRICNSKANEVDHIIPISILLKTFSIKNTQEAINKKELWRLEIGRSLCNNCHKQTPTYGGQNEAINVAPVA
jgi:hypothetical protein